jgi:AbrB family looped-hinge helix DNA binding protein
MKTVIDESGRIQLPEDVRTQLGVKAGDEILLEERAGEWVLKSANTDTGLSWEGNVLVHKGTSTVSAAIEDLIEQARDERFRQLCQGMTP